MYFARYIIYLAHYLIFFLFGILQFVSKPGSRYIVPVLLAVAMYYERGYFYPTIGSFLDGFHQHVNQPGMVERLQRQASRMYYGSNHEWWIMDGAVAVIYLVLVSVYLISSHIINLVIGTIPPVTKPLPPLKKLRTKTREITTAPVRIVVPPL